MRLARGEFGLAHGATQKPETHSHSGRSPSARKKKKKRELTHAISQWPVLGFYYQIIIYFLPCAFHTRFDMRAFGSSPAPPFLESEGEGDTNTGTQTHTHTALAWLFALCSYHSETCAWLINSSTVGSSSSPPPPSGDI